MQVGIEILNHICRETNVQLGKQSRKKIVFIPELDFDLEMFGQSIWKNYQMVGFIISISNVIVLG